MKLLYAGELRRMYKYGITGASLAVVLLWIVALHFAEAAAVKLVFPLVLFIDATMMAFLYAGVTIVFENQENTIKSMMVLPITKGEYLLAKSLAVVTSGLFTLVLLVLYATMARGVGVNVPGLVGAVAISAFAFAQAGIIMTYYSKDFTDLLMNMFRFTILLAVPTILEFLNVVNASWLKTLQYLNPTKNAMVLLQGAVVPVERADLVIAVLYLLVLGVLLHRVACRLFDEYAIKGGA